MAKRLVDQSFADKVFYANSGTEANEAAIKFSRKYARLQGDARAAWPSAIFHLFLECTQADIVQSHNSSRPGMMYRPLYQPCLHHAALEKVALSGAQAEPDLKALP